MYNSVEELKHFWESSSEYEKTMRHIKKLTEKGFIPVTGDKMPFYIFKAVYEKLNSSLKKTIYSNDHAKCFSKVEHYWNSTSFLLFIGFEFNQNDQMTEILSKLAQKHPSYHHYAILEYPTATLLETTRIKTHLMSINITPIWFENGRYDQINLILKMILEGKKEERNPDNTTDYAEKTLDKIKKLSPSLNLDELNKATVKAAKENVLETTPSHKEYSDSINNNKSKESILAAFENENRKNNIKSESKEYKIGVTFTGTYRSNIVEPICKALIKNHHYERKDIFYDDWHKTKIVGISADETLQKIYRNQCECIVVFLSKDYKEKFWTNNIEWKSIKELITTSDKKRILLFKMDSLDINTINGLNSERDIFIDINSYKKDGKISIDSVAMDIDEFYENIKKSTD